VGWDVDACVCGPRHVETVWGGVGIGGGGEKETDRKDIQSVCKRKRKRGVRQRDGGTET
jgi:hypothetical protein